MKVLITGVTGLLGSHLAEYLARLAPDTELYGFKRWRTPRSSLAALGESLQLIEGDVTDGVSVSAAVEQVRPDRIFHYAAQSYSQESLSAPYVTLETNLTGTVHVLEAARRFCPEARILVAGSSAAYGMVRPEDAPVAEGHPLRPTTPYGVSKAAQELVAQQYALPHGLHVSIARFFLQVGPRQAERTSIQTFARQIAEIERGEREPEVRVGNLWPVRDFTDARDSARAAWLLTEHGEPGEAYNVCSGVGLTMQVILDALLALSSTAIAVVRDEARVRAVDEPVVLGDPSRLRAETGWTAEIPFETTLLDVLNHWRALPAGGYA